MSKPTEVTEIGLFQLENLFLTRARYGLFDLREDPTFVGPSNLVRILGTAQKVHAQDIESYVVQHKTSKDLPIILFCEDGKKSGSAARKLEAAGFKNVYVVERGIAGLLAEL
jgi:rhodanese-related sulfurtransferase